MSEQIAHTTTGASQTLPLIVIDGAVVFPYTVASLPLDEQTAPAAEAALLDELSKLSASGPTAAELRKAKNSSLAGYWQQLKTINAKAEALGAYEIFRGDYRKLFTAPDRYDRVTGAEIQALARKSFVEKNRTVGVLYPMKDEAAR